MQAQTDLINRISAQIRLEKETAKKIREIEDTTSNLATKLFLAEMRYDTEKHAKILETMSTLMQHVKPGAKNKRFWQVETQSYVDALAAKRMLEKHLNVETEMLKRIEETMAKTEDEALKLLFDHIKEDEKKHHAILKKILKHAFRVESIP
jgi:rubrerythrin